MRTTVVHRRRNVGPVDIARPCSRPIATPHGAVRPRTFPLERAEAPPALAPWSTAKLGLVISTLAAIVALLVDAATAVPAHVIVLAVMAVAFAASLHATTRRRFH